MASITKLGKKWRAQVARKGIRKSAVWDTEKEAIAWAARVEKEIDAGMLHDKTFGQAVEHYLETVSVHKGSPEWERRRFDAFTVFFKVDTELASITSATVGQWRDWRLKGEPKTDTSPGRPPVSGSTVQREVNLLRNLFAVARDEWKWIDHNPFQGVRLPDENDPRHQLWRWQDMRRVLRADRTGKTAEVIKAFHIALHTALRLSEVLTGRYDPTRRLFELHRSKSDGTKRVLVPVPRRAAKLFPAVFTVDPNEASALFSRLTDQLMIDDLTFHDTRATALTLLSRRMDVMTLARISRHKDINLLFNTYYRERPEEIAARI